MGNGDAPGCPRRGDQRGGGERQSSDARAAEAQVGGENLGFCLGKDWGSTERAGDVFREILDGAHDGNVPKSPAFDMWPLLPDKRDPPKTSAKKLCHQYAIHGN